MSLSALYQAIGTCALLLLAGFWCAAMGSPVPGASALSGPECEQCAATSKELLLSVRELLKNADLFPVMVRLNEVMELNNNTQTALACAPIQKQGSSCVLQRLSPFSESDCVGNIMKDLVHYAALLQSYLDQPSRMYPEKEEEVLSPTRQIIQSLLKSCSLVPATENLESTKEYLSGLWTENSFDNRQKMYKAMQGFRIRVITINRAFGYIASGDHKR